MKDVKITEKEIAAKIPEYVRAVMERIHEAGEESYVVGGSLRDIILGIAPHDFDLATSARPDVTAEIFKDMRVIATGIKHGTVTVISEGEPIEITTFRVDGSYTDSRHPDKVSFTSRIEEDLSRRDFTVNAMAFSPRKGLVDPFGGRQDILRRTIRAVGDPETRFGEDALRIMRAFRFSAQLDFSIDGETLLGAEVCRRGLDNIARERIAAELTRLLTSNDPAPSLCLMTDSGILQQILGGYTADRKLLRLLKEMPQSDIARLGLFLCSTDADGAREILRSLKCSNKQTVGALAVRRGAYESIESPADARRFIAGMGIYAEEAVRASVLLGNSPEDAVAWVRGNNAPCSLSELALSGRDLMSMGIGGKDIGRILEELLERVIDDPRLNDRDTLLELAKNIKEEKTK